MRAATIGAAVLAGAAAAVTVAAPAQAAPPSIIDYSYSVTEVYDCPGGTYQGESRTDYRLVELLTYPGRAHLTIRTTETYTDDTGALIATATSREAVVLVHPELQSDPYYWEATFVIPTTSVVRSADGEVVAKEAGVVRYRLWESAEGFGVLDYKEAGQHHLRTRCDLLDSLAAS
ncbi:hypothetical protein [Naasia sp. SYSU D00948]|uniref:hypothetical protein n=1 Tax=Naasia sp. SYSU D00948 TaxID=2817379 RepID=UPI001B30C8A2|nr:hypothetical protein [Naasia sp. SYSU D00948]